MAECVITRIAKAAMIAILHDETDFSELFMLPKKRAHVRSGRR